MAANTPGVQLDTTQERYKAAIREALGSNSLTIFVGAGVTVGAITNSTVAKTGVEKQARGERLLWQGLLLSGLAYVADDERYDHWEHSEKIEHDTYTSVLQTSGPKPTSGTILRAAAFLKNKLKDEIRLPDWHKHEFRELYRDWIGSGGNVMLDAFKGFYEEGARIITTNYDDLLSKHFQNASVILPEDTLGVGKFFRRTAEKKGVMHVHGYWGEPEGTVLDAVDYFKVTENSRLGESLKSIFDTSEVLLFVGTGDGLKDPHFSRLMEWAGKRLTEDSKRHYILLQNGEKLEQKYFNPLRYGRHYEDLPGFLQGLIPSEHQQSPRLPFPPNANFLNQSKILASLDNYFSKPSNRCIAVLHGIDGVGKTQCAIQYCHANLDKYPSGIFWLNASSLNTLKDSWRMLAADMGLSKNEQELNSAEKFLSQRTRWLCILDDLEDFQLVSKLLSWNGVGNVLITTTDATKIDLMTMSGILVDHLGWEDVIRLFLLSLNSWTADGSLYIRSQLIADVNDDSPLRPEIRNFLESTLEITTSSQLVAVYSLTGGLPHSIVHVASSLRMYQMSFDDYVRQIDATGPSLGAASEAESFATTGNTQFQPIKNVWELSFQKLENENPLALILLTYFSFLNYSRISERLLREATQDVSIWNESACLAVPEFVRKTFFFLNGTTYLPALGRLRSLQFVRRSSVQNVLLMDRMVHQSVRQRLTSEQAAQALEKVLCLLCNQLPPLLYSPQSDTSAPQRASDVFTHLEHVSNMVDLYMPHLKNIRAECAVLFVEAYLWYQGSQYLGLAERLVSRLEPISRSYVERMICGARLHQIVASFQADLSVTLDRGRYQKYLKRLESTTPAPPGTRYIIVQAMISLRLMQTLDRKIQGTQGQIQYIRNNIGEVASGSPSISGPTSIRHSRAVSVENLESSSITSGASKRSRGVRKLLASTTKVFRSHSRDPKTSKSGLQAQLPSTSPPQVLSSTNSNGLVPQDVEPAAPTFIRELWNKPQEIGSIFAPAWIPESTNNERDQVSSEEDLADEEATRPMIMKSFKVLANLNPDESSSEESLPDHRATAPMILESFKVLADSTLVSSSIFSGKGKGSSEQASHSHATKDPIDLVCKAILARCEALQAMSHDNNSTALKILQNGKEGAAIASENRLSELDGYLEDMLRLQLQVCIIYGSEPIDAGIEAIKMTFDCHRYSAILTSRSFVDSALTQAKTSKRVVSLLAKFASCTDLFDWIPADACFVSSLVQETWLGRRMDSIISANLLLEPTAVNTILKLGEVLRRREDSYAREKALYARFLPEYLRLDYKYAIERLSETYYQTLLVRNAEEREAIILLSEDMMHYAQESTRKSKSPTDLCLPKYEIWAKRLLQGRSADSEFNAYDFCSSVLVELTQTNHANRCTQWGEQALHFLLTRNSKQGKRFCRRMTQYFHEWPAPDYRMEFLEKWAVRYENLLKEVDPEALGEFQREVGGWFKEHGSARSSQLAETWLAKADAVEDRAV